ncbi:biotin transporter BioY [Caldisalinibacter kiritimatiensis]|uniref:Biotin transporter n=1 Tax=Caldisalinibacter kiritimatiensis TaxID=1304284 RepID=R1ATT3_9FIRM|nr:biotin transporter BioY [Caldisalinibacter kiritimatiensis]EOD00057.1 Substrate-specific component BioY of biotin ECF transporter [Caldisalinibacter kiritimatiensis]
MSTRDLVYASIFTAITATCAQIFIYTPFSPVPITLQVLAVFLSGAILGSKLGLISQLVYILLGTIGVPVFAGFKGGLHIIVGLYGGYITAFPIASFVIGILVNLYKGKSPIKNIAVNIFAMAIGLMIIYIFGVCQYSLLSNVGFIEAIPILIIPFVIPDLIKLAIGGFIAPILKRSLKKADLI